MMRVFSFCSLTTCDDNFWQFVKLGYAGENFPRHIFQSMVGRPQLRAEEGDIAKDIVIKV